jgi:rod shape-determining protein MreC
VANALPGAAREQVSSALRSTVLAPFLWVQSSIHEAGVLTLDLEQLQARLDSVQALLLEQSTLEQENRSLRGLLDLRGRGGPRFTPASVIRSGTLGSESMFLLDVGGLDGVAENDAVVSPDGLLGTIRGVTPRTAVAMDWTHPDFRASAMTLGGEVLGVVEPSPGSFREEDRLIFRGVPYHTDIEIGTPVVTSGVGAVYPRGIPLGIVGELAETDAGWARSYFLEPAARPGAETHVLVLGRTGGTEAELLEEALGIEGLFRASPDSVADPIAVPPAEPSVEPALEPIVAPTAEPPIAPAVDSTPAADSASGTDATPAAGPPPDSVPGSTPDSVGTGGL